MRSLFVGLAVLLACSEPVSIEITEDAVSVGEQGKAVSVPMAALSFDGLENLPSPTPTLTPTPNPLWTPTPTPRPTRIPTSTPTPTVTSANSIIAELSSEHPGVRLIREFSFCIATRVRVNNPYTEAFETYDDLLVSFEEALQEEGTSHMDAVWQSEMKKTISDCRSNGGF